MLSDLHTRLPKYGWIPDLPDQRDFPYSLLALDIPTFLPNKIDLRTHCSPVENQGDIGSCTANALVGNLEFLKINRLKKLINFSRLFLYYNERLIRKTTDIDSGASLRDGIKSLVKVGDCRESLWPYDPNKLKLKPNKRAYTDAINHQITKYYKLSSLSEMKHTLSLDFPFVFGFAVYESFESDPVAKTGVIMAMVTCPMHISQTNSSRATSGPSEIWNNILVPSLC